MYVCICCCDMVNNLPIKCLLNSVVKPRQTSEQERETRGIILSLPQLSIRLLFFLFLDVSIGHSCCETRGKESCAAMEPASRLQNKAEKTNTGLKLDFPKHSIPSHFTHHCGLETRIE